MSGLTRDDINRIIQDNGLFHGTMALGVVMDANHLEKFVAIVAAVEREACAKVCEDIYNDPKDNNGYDAYYTRPYLECAAAIRARGKVDG